MASKILNSKCITCSKGFLNTKQKTVQRAQCSNCFRLKCTDLNKNTYQSFSGDKVLFVSIAHTNHALL